MAGKPLGTSYRSDALPVTYVSRDGRTTADVHKRKDGRWAWTGRRGGRKVAGDDAGPNGMQRCRALAAAKRFCGDGAKVEKATR